MNYKKFQIKHFGRSILKAFPFIKTKWALAFTNKVLLFALGLLVGTCKCWLLDLNCFTFNFGLPPWHSDEVKLLMGSQIILYLFLAFEFCFSFGSIIWVQWFATKYYPKECYKTSGRWCVGALWNISIAFVITIANALVLFYIYLLGCILVYCCSVITLVTCPILFFILTIAYANLFLIRFCTLISAGYGLFDTGDFEFYDVFFPKLFWVSLRGIYLFFPAFMVMHWVGWFLEGLNDGLRFSPRDISCIILIRVYYPKNIIQALKLFALLLTLGLVMLWFLYTHLICHAAVFNMGRRLVKCSLWHCPLGKGKHDLCREGRHILTRRSEGNTPVGLTMGGETQFASILKQCPFLDFEFDDSSNREPFSVETEVFTTTDCQAEKYNKASNSD